MDANTCRMVEPGPIALCPLTISYCVLPLVAQSCPTLCDPMDCSLPGSTVRGILQAWILEWVAISSSRGISQPRDQTCICDFSCTGRQVLLTLVPPEKPSPHPQLRGKKACDESVQVRHLRHQSVSQFSLSVVSDSLQHHEPQHARPPCQSPAPGVHPSSCPLSGSWHPTISSFVVPFSSCPQSLPASGYFKMVQPFAWGGQSIGVSASASVLPMNTQDWSPLGWTGWISLQSNGLSRVFSNTTVQKHQFFGTQLSSQFDSRIHTWPLEKS